MVLPIATAITVADVSYAYQLAEHTPIMGMSDGKRNAVNRIGDSKPLTDASENNSGRIQNGKRQSKRISK